MFNPFLNTACSQIDLNIRYLCFSSIDKEPSTTSVLHMIAPEREVQITQWHMCIATQLEVIPRDQRYYFVQTYRAFAYSARYDFAVLSTVAGPV